MFLHRILRVTAIFAIALSLFLNIAVPPGLTLNLPLLNRETQNLPLPDPEFNGTIEETYDQSEADYNTLLGPQPPEDAPNILLVLLDDVGFGASEAFGGPIHTPTLNDLVQNGLSYNRFHTTALCSPTRAALLTGRNSHSTASGMITGMATGFPGYTGLIPQSTATVAQILQAHGYSTSWFGKSHNTPENQTSMVGPFARWPNDLGFDYFYGFMAGETDQWYPTLYENRNPIEQPSYPDEDDLNNSYNLNRDLADKAISWLRYNHSLSPDNPFFLYFSPGATHAPHQPPPSYTDKYKAGGEHAIAAGYPNGMFVDGWDVEQANICAKQKAQGVIPTKAKCTERPDEIPAWDDPQFDLEGARDLLALQMQTYAGFLEYTDEEVGRVIDAIDDLGEKENTLIIYIVGDNGASAEGSIPGTCNEIANLGGAPFTMEDNLECKDKWGGPETSPHFAIGWAWATDSPFRWTKQVASYFGGTRNPMVISWPERIQATGIRGEDLRDQFLHVIDVAPTILEVAKIEPPKKFNGIKQKDLEGASFANTFENDGASQPAPRDTQYFEISAHRGVYNNGWMASAFHRVPWITTGTSPIDEDKWELFNLDEDFTQHDDLSAENPIKLAKLKALFDRQAEKYNVFPLDDRYTERFMVERPTVLGDRTYFEFYPGAIHLPGASAPNVANTSYRITADLNISDADKVEGVVLANGGTAGGYSLYVTEDHELVYEYNYVDLERTLLTAPTPLSNGSIPVKVEFVYDGDNTCSIGFGCGGEAFLYVNDMTTPVDSSRIEATFPGRFGVDTQDVGMDLQAPVSNTYQLEPPFEFTGGEIEKVTIDIDPFNETLVSSEF